MAVDLDKTTRHAPAVLVLAVGFAGGLLSGLFGVGGGVILVPAMVTMMGIAQHRAQGTSLAVIVPTAIVGVGIYARYDPIPVPIAAPMAVGAMLLAFVSSNVVHRVPAFQLKIMFFVLVIATAVRLFLGGGAEAATSATHAAGTTGLALGAALIGAVAGVLSGLLGVGGGIIIAPLASLALDQPQHIAQGISLSVIVPTAAVGAWTSLRKGAVDLRVAGLITAASILGSLAGANLAHLLSGPVLRRLFAVVLIILGYHSLPPSVRRDLWSRLRASQAT